MKHSHSTDRPLTFQACGRCTLAETCSYVQHARLYRCEDVRPCERIVTWSIRFPSDVRADFLASARVESGYTESSGGSSVSALLKKCSLTFPPVSSRKAWP